MVEPSAEAPRVTKKLVHPFETWLPVISNPMISIPVNKIFLFIIISFNFFDGGKYNDFGYLKYDLSRLANASGFIIL
jgi:hypothetical protein